MKRPALIDQEQQPTFPGRVTGDSLADLALPVELMRGADFHLRQRPEAGNKVGTVSARRCYPRLLPAHLWPPSSAATRYQPGSDGTGAFLGVKGSRVQIPPSRRRTSRSEGLRRFRRGPLPIRGAKRGTPSAVGHAQLRSAAWLRKHAAPAGPPMQSLAIRGRARD